MALIALLDASVLVSLFIEDVWTERAWGGLRDGITPAVTDFALAEFVAVVGRGVRTRRLDRDEAESRLADLDAWIAGMTARHSIAPADLAWAMARLRRFDLNLRAPDAIHLAAASRLSLPVWTFDAGMATAARALSLPLADA